MTLPRNPARPDRGPGANGTIDKPATLRLREPADVLGAIPFLVGYHPDDSAVVIGLRGKQLEFTLRIDLPPDDASPAELREIRERICAKLSQHRVTGALFVGYGPNRVVRPLLRGLRRACEAAGIDVKESLRSQDGRYWSYLCRNPRCCPPGGTPYDPRSGVVAAEATLAGRVALPDFTAYAAQLEPVDRPADATEVSQRMTGRLVDLLAGSAGEDEALQRLLADADAAITSALELTRTGAFLGEEEMAWLSVLVMAYPIRDEAWDRIRRVPRDDIEPHRALWLEIMRRCDPDLRPAPATLFAFAAWRCGDTKLAGLALERVLDYEPDYILAETLLECISQGIAPSQLAMDPGGMDPGGIDRGGIDRGGINQRSRRRVAGEGSRQRPRRGRAPRRRSSSRRAGSQPK
jgi:hypothetical protein